MKKKTAVIAVATLFLTMALQAPHVLATAGVWSANSTTIYYTDGNVGIGTSTPGGKLSINGTNPAFTIGNQMVPGNSEGIQFLDSGNQHAGIRYADDGSRNLYIEDASNNIGSPTDWFNATNPINLVVRNGRLGVNTSSPKAPIHSMATGASLLLEGANMTFMEWYPMGYPNGRRAYTGFASPNDTKFTIQNNGNIFLSPDGGKVIVNSELRATSLKITNNLWADYVFEDSYKLKPLNEVEMFIKENKHLPNVPSASEVDQEGLSVGDMQAKQMEKIEELTLYVIDLQKQVDVMKAEILNLRKEEV